MADLRTLKLSLLADTKDFISGLDRATAESKTFSQKLGGALGKAAKAFGALGIAAGTAAVAIGVDAVKAAVEDQKSQELLADALRNSTKATDGQIKSTEDYIKKTQLATGVSDSKLRPALGNLARATGDVTKAQELNTLALDISVATGKDVETISLALAKAYDGNIGALRRLGIPLDESIVKSKDFEAATVELEKLFGGSAAAAADTYAGRLAIIQERVGEAKESLGEALLPILEKVSKFLEQQAVPAFEGLIRGLTGGPKSVRGATKETNSAFADMGIVLNDNDTAAYNLGQALSDLGESLGDLFKTTEEGAAEESGLVRFIKLLERMVDAVDRMIERIDNVKTKIREFNDAFNNSAIGQFVNATGQFAPEVGQTRVKNLPAVGSGRVPAVNIRISGTPDPQAAARTIVKTLSSQRLISGVTVPAGRGF
jgi:hypothetical protein